MAMNVKNQVLYKNNHKHTSNLPSFLFIDYGNYLFSSDKNVITQNRHDTYVCTSLHHNLIRK